MVALAPILAPLPTWVSRYSSLRSTELRGVYDIGEYHARAAEDIISQDDSVVNGYIVLNTDVISEDGFSSYIDVLPEHAAFANFGAGHHMYPMPDFGAGSNVRGLVNDGGFVNEDIFHGGSQFYTLKLC